jgi:hypothetical protein
MWCYADFILIPHQQAESVARGIPRGNLSDLYPRWFGSRELLLHHRDPYSAEVTREIQSGYYGRALDPNRPNDPVDQQGFAYPVYVAFLLAPTITTPFPIVLVAFRWFLCLVTILTIPLWFRAIGWRVSHVTTVTWMIATLGSFAAVQGIKLQQLTLLVCGLLAGGMAALVSGHFLTAGALLALATIKPQLAGILIAWLALWSISDWHARKRFVHAFVATLLALFAGGELLLHGWISRFRAAASEYMRYTGGGKSVLDVVTGPFGGLLSFAILALVAVFCWKTRRAGAAEDAFASSLALVMVATLVVIPTYAPYNQLLLLPALMLIIRDGLRVWRRGRVSRLFCLTAGLTLAWSWIAAALLSGLLIFVSRTQAQSAWALPLLSNFYVPLMVLAMTALCAWPYKRVPKATELE